MKVARGILTWRIRDRLTDGQPCMHDDFLVDLFRAWFYDEKSSMGCEDNILA